MDKKTTAGHIMALIKQGIPNIFCPSVLFEQEEQKNAQNHLKLVLGLVF